MYNLTEQKGFTLIEVLISMMLFTIILVAFLSLFTSSLLNIYSAGDKGSAYSVAQADVESRISTEESIATDDLTLIFGGEGFEIPGGLVDSYQEQGQRSSNLTTFIAEVPTIEIEPSTKTEGSSPPDIIVTGMHTNFENDNTNVQILDKFGSIIYNLGSANVTSATAATFNLQEDLINAQGKYYIRVITSITEMPDEVVRAEYQVTQPNFLIAGNNSLRVSKHADYWMDRTSLGEFPAFSGSLNGACFGNSKYVVVGSDGMVFTSGDQKDWERNIIDPNIALHDATWSSNLQKYYVVGEAGTIYSSSNGTVWQLVDHELTVVNLNGITALGDVLIAVGDDGTVLRKDSGSWELLDISEENLNSVQVVSSGEESYNIIVVGNNGIILTSSDGKAWEDVSYSGNIALNDIYYLGYYYVAVGDDGLIIKENTENGWQVVEPPEAYQNTNFNAIYYGVGNKVVVVGDDGTIATSDQGMSEWLSYTVGSNNFYSVTGR